MRLSKVMGRIALLAGAIVLSGPTTVRGQVSVAEEWATAVRAEFQRINAAESGGQLQVRNFTRNPGGTLQSMCTGRKLRKLIVNGITGGSGETEKYYFYKGKPVFIAAIHESYGGRTEEKFYFRDGRIFRHINARGQINDRPISSTLPTGFFIVRDALRQYGLCGA